MSQRERMAQMFDAIDADGRRYVLAILQHEFDRVQKDKGRRPALRLVDGGQAGSPTPVGAVPRLALAVLPARSRT